MAEHHDISRVHFVGIGGAGMSGLAHILLERGGVVSGSDRSDGENLRWLESLGAHVAVGHAASNLELSGQAPTAVVTSFAAIPKDNPELVAARERGIPVLRRSDLLAELLAGHNQVLVAGTHGKTSTSSFVVAAMTAAGLDPSFAVGGVLGSTGTNSHQGSGPDFVAEADESDASLLSYRPDIAVVTNIEPDHLDYFGDAESYFKVFEDFCDLLGPGGTLVACLDDPHAGGLAARRHHQGVRVAAYGTARAAAEHPHVPRLARILATEHTATGTLARVDLDGTTVEFTVHTPGEHMVLNATGALVAGYLCGGEPEKLAAGITASSGVHRRFESHGTVAAGRCAGAEVFDDYAHHPSEVDAVLRAARARVEARGSGRVVVAFQPHLYSRTAEFADEFAEALSLADEVVVLDVYAAREEPVEGVDGGLIAGKIDGAVFEPDAEAAPARVAELAGPGDVVITMGAGSVTKLADPVFAALGGEAGDAAGAIDADSADADAGAAR